MENNQNHFIKIFIDNNFKNNNNILNTFIILDLTILSKFSTNTFKINSNFNYIYSL